MWLVYHLPSWNPVVKGVNKPLYESTKQWEFGTSMVNTTYLWWNWGWFMSLFYQHTIYDTNDTVCTTYHDISRISNLHFGVFNFPLCWLKRSMHTPLSHHTWYSPRRDSIISPRHGEVICVYGAPRTWPRWWTSLMISWHVGGGHVFSPFFTRPQKIQTRRRSRTFIFIL